MFVSAISGQVVRCHDGDPDAEKMTEFTVKRRAQVTLNGRKCGLADLNPGDEVDFSGGGKEGFEVVTATRSKDSAFSAKSARADLGKPREVELVKPESPGLTPKWVEPDTSAGEVPTSGDAARNQPPAKQTSRSGHDTPEGVRTKREAVESGATTGNLASEDETGRDESRTRSPLPPPKKSGDKK